MSRASRFLAALVAFLSLSTAAWAATAPTTPTFVLAWGNQGAAAGQFYNPSGVATDATGNVYVVDQSNHRIQKFDRLGNFITQWGD
jgi:DNA-binding beta-propeller fold protein YncE